MQVGRSSHGSARFATLIALALLIKALVPAGWMPQLEGGTLTLRLCGGATPAPASPPAAQDHHGTMSHDAGASSGHHDAHGGQDRHEKEQPTLDEPCAFAAAGLSWTAPVPGAAPAPLPFAAAIADPHQREVVIGRGLAAPPPPQTGPPLLT